MAKAGARDKTGTQNVVKRKSVLHAQQSQLGRKSLQKALLLEVRQKAQARWGNKVSGAAKHVTSTMATVPDHERAGYPLVVGKVKPKDWKTVDGLPLSIDLNRKTWLPDDWGQAVKVTKPIATSRPGAHGAFIIYINGDGVVKYHKSSVDEFVGRKTGAADGFNGMMRTAKLQCKQTDEQKFFNILTPKERANLPSADALHFCVVSARRTSSGEGLRDIATVQAKFQLCGVKPTWYVDKESLGEYRKLGLDAVVGGKLTEARNLCLVDAAKKGKACVQVSDDITRWEYFEGPGAQERTDDAVNAAHAAAKVHTISPVAAARFLLAKLRSTGSASSRPQLAGIYPLGSCSRAFASAEFSPASFIIGDFFVADRSPIRFDANMKLKEDYDFTCSHLKKHGSVIRANRMVICAKHYSNSGGACSVRDKKGLEEQRNIEILRSKWPRVFSNNPKRKNEVILRWKGCTDEASEGDCDSTSTSLKKVGGSTKPVKKSPLFSKEFKPASRVVKGPMAPKMAYIRRRCELVANKKLVDLLGKLSYKDTHGKAKPYTLPDLRYDLRCNFLALRQ